MKFQWEFEINGWLMDAIEKRFFNKSVSSKKKEIDFVKQRMKRQAKYIRTLKNIIKDGMKNDEPMKWFQRRLDEAKMKFRYDHVAYSILNGNNYEEIEPIVSKNNEINMKIVELAMKTMAMKAIKTSNN